MSMIHITIKQKGQEPRPRRCHADATLFTCPFCTTDVCKPRQYHQIMTHIAGHKLRAVEYGDHVIYSCNIGCGKKARHFHCCQCPKIYINKGAIKKHLCSAHPIATCTPETQPVSHPLQEPPSQQQPASNPSPESPSQQPEPHPPPEPPSQQQPTSHLSPESPSQQQPTSHPSKEPPSQQPEPHPPPELPSKEQPTSHPSPEPPSQQQPASNPSPESPSQQQPTSHPSPESTSQQQPTSHPSPESPSQQPEPHPPPELPSKEQPASHPSPEPPSQQQPASNPSPESPSQQPEPPSQQQPTSHPSKEPPSQQQPASNPSPESPSHQPEPHSPPEPPSQQQPTSHPSPESPSQQQPTFHPSKEPPSQQPEPHPPPEPPSQQQQASHPSPEPPSQQQPASNPSPESPSQQQPTSHPSKEPPSQQQPASNPSPESTSHQPEPHPPPEPPSQQQPTSHPSPESPSQQQPTFHPSKEPPSQQPEPHPPPEPPSQQQQASHPPPEPPSQQQPATHPPPEPPSQQQPASHPPPEPPSQQQPASQPPPEPPSQQQPASQPQELDLQQAAPPAIGRKQISVQCRSRHITVKQRGQAPRPRRCHADATLFTCPFCTTDVCKPRQYHQIMTHIAGHKLRAVEYGDYVIYSCNIGCEKKARHFHCCQCPKTCINKGAIKKHLCSAHPIATCTPEPQPVSHPLQEHPSQQQPASQPQELDLQQAGPDPQELAASPAIEKKHISVQVPRRHITVKQKGQAPQPRRCHADATLFTCPFCTTDVCKPRQYHQIMTHIAGHKLRAVEYGDYVIYSCNVGCEKKARHFHCCQCPKTYINKGAIKKHLCSAHPIATCTPEPQPVSHPLQEPASQPQELDLQQAAPDPQELAASPAIEKKHISVQVPRRHITVKQKGQAPRPRRCHADATLFTCPFCTTDVCKPRQYHQIMTHIAGHKLRVVEYGDYVIYSCNIGCGKKARHFHCCNCPKTFFNKSDLKRHLCSAHPIAPETPSLQPPAPGLLPAHPVMAQRKKISAQCTHCGLSLNSKNLKKHIERKHHEALQPVTSVLPAQCVDKKNGLFVVLESFCGPCTPIHVVKKFWGSSHKVKCEMDNCNSRVEVAQRSGHLVAQCVHLSSVDYTCAVAPSEDLSEHLLTEMVERKWIGDIRKKQCLKLQNQAMLKGATFTSLVTIGGPDYVYYISIYEPKVSYYSKLGRVLVDYNAKTNTWNCPCGKGGKSCLHKSIAKWCLYQMKKQLFKNLLEAEEENESAQLEDLSSQQLFQKWVPSD